MPGNALAVRAWSYLDVNSRDESPHFLGLIVEPPTRICYGNQSEGLACLWRTAEGYLSVLGAGELATRYIKFFERFAGRPPLSGGEWEDDDLDELAALVSETAHHWLTDESGFGQAPAEVTLDRSQVNDLAEGWIPVVVGDKTGAIVFPNSD